MLHAVIMAGGSGTRFWPRSRLRRPKQLIEIIGRGSMLQQTVARLRPALPAENFLVVTHRDQAAEARRQLPALKPAQVLAEPCGRDTSACIGLAAMVVRRRDPEAVMAVLAADHVVSPSSEFVRCVREAAKIAVSRRALVTFGVRPTHPSDLYGYIRRGRPLSGWKGALKAFHIAQFREKPTCAAAEKLIRTGEYYWNSGNFVWRAADILDALRTFMPELYAGLQKIAPALGTGRQKKVLEKTYPSLPRLSIDYGAMEKAPNAVVVESRFGWDDVGAWDAVARHNRPDAAGNVVLGRHAGIDTKGCIVAGEDGHLIGTVGVENLIIVHTPDATLVCDRRRAAQVKALVELLRQRGFDAYL